MWVALENAIRYMKAYLIEQVIVIDMSKGTTSTRGVWFSLNLLPDLIADLQDAGSLTSGEDGQRLPTKE